MKQLLIKKTLLASLMLGALSWSSAQAETVTLLDENFDAGISVCADARRWFSEPESRHRLD